MKKKFEISNEKNKDFNIELSKISLNKEIIITKRYEYKENNLENFLKSIGNLFIDFYNYISEKEQLEKNINNYLENLNKLINNYINTYEEEIKSIKDEVLKRIDYISNINKISLNKILKNIDEYKRIKKEYYNLINVND